MCDGDTIANDVYIYIYIHIYIYIYLKESVMVILLPMMFVGTSCISKV